MIALTETPGALLVRGDSAESLSLLVVELIEGNLHCLLSRDRPSELSRLVNSLIHTCAQPSGHGSELLVVDDAALPNRLLRSLAKQAHSARIHWVYHNKRQRQGLLRWRIEALGQK